MGGLKPAPTAGVSLPDKSCPPDKSCLPTRFPTDKSSLPGKKCRYDPPVEPEERHRNCWYGRRTVQLPEHLGSHTIVDGELVYCAHPMYWPVVRYEFDLRNCEDCDV